MPARVSSAREFQGCLAFGGPCGCAGRRSLVARHGERAHDHEITAPRKRPYPVGIAARSRPMSTRRRILPDGDLGISSMISTARTFL